MSILTTLLHSGKNVHKNYVTPVTTCQHLVSMVLRCMFTYQNRI